MSGEALPAEAQALVAEIDRAAEAEKQKTLAQARDQAALIQAEADARIQRAVQEAELVTEKRARVDEDRLLGQARLDAQAERLAGLRRVFQRVFQTAEQRIEDLVRSSRYAGALKILIAKALEQVPGAAVVTVALADQKMCGDLLAELGRRCRVEGRDLAPGSVIVATEDGRIRVDNSLNVRLASAHVVLETQITRCLHG